MLRPKRWEGHPPKRLTRRQAYCSECFACARDSGHGDENACALSDGLLQLPSLGAACIKTGYQLQKNIVPKELGIKFPKKNKKKTKSLLSRPPSTPPPPPPPPSSRSTQPVGSRPKPWAFAFSSSSSEKRRRVGRAFGLPLGPFFGRGIFLLLFLCWCVCVCVLYFRGGGGGGVGGDFLVFVFVCVCPFIFFPGGGGVGGLCALCG